MTQRTYPEAVQHCVRRCRRVARTALVIVTLFWIIFALLKGFHSEGGMLSIFDDFSTIFPWLAILILWFVAWRWEILGGLLIIIFSIYMAFDLGVFEGTSTEGMMIITPLAMTGFMFVFIGFRIWYARKADAAQQQA